MFWGGGKKKLRGMVLQVSADLDYKNASTASNAPQTGAERRIFVSAKLSDFARSPLSSRFFVQFEYATGKMRFIIV